jgi:type II secretory pathway component PulC
VPRAIAAPYRKQPLLLAAEVRPNVLRDADGRSVALVLREVRDGGLVDAVGLREGDRIVAVNGMPARGPGDVPQLIVALQWTDVFRVDLERGDTTLRRVIELTP